MKRIVKGNTLPKNRLPEPFRQVYFCRCGKRIQRGVRKDRLRPPIRFTCHACRRG
jgi:hypothetical protein